MTNDQLVLVLGFGSTTMATIAGIATSIISNKAAAKKADQQIALRALELQEAARKIAEHLAETTEEAARRLEVKTSSDHAVITQRLTRQDAVMAKQTAELRENTRLTEVGNGVKSDIRQNQAEIAQIKQSLTPSQQLDRIETASVDTNVIVNKIKNDIINPPVVADPEKEK